MRRIRRVVVASVGLVLLFVALVFGASESGEVVVLQTADASDTWHSTRLWVVEHDGASWLRAGDPTSAWLLRLRERPEVIVERAGVRRRYRALPSEDAGVRDRVHALLAEKYGLADRVIAVIRDEKASVPVRLETLD